MKFLTGVFIGVCVSAMVIGFWIPSDQLASIVQNSELKENVGIVGAGGLIFAFMFRLTIFGPISRWHAEVRETILYGDE